MASCNMDYQFGYSFCEILFASVLPRGLRMRLFNVCMERQEQNRTRDVSWLMECMPSMYTALGSISRTTENWVLCHMLVIQREVEAG